MRKKMALPEISGHVELQLSLALMVIFKYRLLKYVKNETKVTKLLLFGYNVLNNFSLKW